MLLAAILFSLHHWVAIVKSAGDYSPFDASGEASSLTFDETCCYAPFAGRFMWSGQLVAEVDNYERRNSSAGVPFVPAVLVGAMGRVLGNLERAFIAADFVFPALALGLLYAASAGIIQSTWFRLLIAWTTLLIPFGARNFLWQGSESMIAAPDFSRTPQPEISFTILIAGVLVASRGLRNSGMRGAIGAGLVGGMIVASYYFYAIGWGVTLATLFLLAAAWRRGAEVKQVAIMLVATIVASAPYIAATVRGTLEGSQRELLSHIGGSAFTHAPSVMPLLGFLVGSLLVWKFGEHLLTGQEHSVRILLLVLLLLAGLAGLNFQILSGYDAAHDKHFWNRLIQPVGFFLAGCWLLGPVEKRQNLRWRDHFAAGLLIVVLLNAGARQLYVGGQIAEQQRASRPEIELLAWIRSHVPGGSVIGTVNFEIVALIPAMGPNFSYLPMEMRTVTPAGEILDRCYDLAVLVAASPDEYYRQRFACVGIPRSFFEASALYSQTHGGPSGKPAYKLDYVVDRSGKPVPPRVAASFPRSTIVHVNQQYQLIQLAER